MATMMKPRKGEVFKLAYSMIALLFIWVICIDFCDAVVVVDVDVYRFIQYNLTYMSFESCLVSFNHHVSSLILTLSPDLSHTIIMKRDSRIGGGGA
ncbi:hypothetical protein LOK49_LG04G00517 [Camellia lanceoleosa]|uniref:Uncharacterized protein n=1 Tax=Camellia lanceoleosa TaxID=1840588 RepID=A0ACC0HU52_9ERIC|nr:hypothetical protein LOK49_LG04G00517 [Camellia lanceoleosa]